MSHLILPKKADWMTMEERADNLMDSRVRGLLPLLDEHVFEKEFFHALDAFYEETKKLSIRGRREEFEKVVLLVIEALIREKYKEKSFVKFQSWRFELHLKSALKIPEFELPVELKDFLQHKKNRRVEGVLDLFYKKQSPDWFNPYVSFVGRRPEENFEIKILFKNISDDLRLKDEVHINHPEFKKLLTNLTLIHQRYIEFEREGKTYVLASKKRQVLAGESVELVLFQT